MEIAKPMGLYPFKGLCSAQVNSHSGSAIDKVAFIYDADANVFHRTFRMRFKTR